MRGSWKRQRYYQHFDPLCSVSFVSKVDRPEFIRSHSWCPLIYFERILKRYKKKDHKCIFKTRPIMYCSHRDAMIFAKYAEELVGKLEMLYDKEGLGDCVLAYRRLGKANYDFAGEVERFVLQNTPCCVLCFDFSKFFDTLDHKYLKARIKEIYECDELLPDLYAVYRALMRFSYVRLIDLMAVPKFADRINAGYPKQIAAIAQVKSAGVAIHRNPNKFGIPQGTPISAAASNAYMIEFDRRVNALAQQVGGLYRRYSDDVIFVAPVGSEDMVRLKIREHAAESKVQINEDKTEINVVHSVDDVEFQYLGFDMTPTGATIRGSSISRQQRKLKYGLRRIAKDGRKAIEESRASKVFTKRLRKRFVDARGRNFPNYARRAAVAFGSKKMVRQSLRIQNRADKQIREL